MTNAKPFVPRDVFRLVVRLEAQKAHDVDTTALEKRFRVPKDYGKEETDEQREQLARLVTPGPGAYAYRDGWAVGVVSETKPSAAFASKAPRSAFPVASSALSAKQTINADACREFLDKPPPLGSFTRADRGIATSSTAKKDESQLNNQRLATPNANNHYSKPKTSVRTSFARAPRDGPSVSKLDLGPAQYDVRRLWDPPPGSTKPTSETPTPAVFGASHDTRTVVWSPARTLPSNAVPEAWNASPHYAKHKRTVLLATEHQRRGASPTLGHANSTPTLGSAPATRGKKAAVSTTATDLDPFEWLRQQPNGEQRANALAQRHGLGHFVRPVSSHANINANANAEPQSVGVGGHVTEAKLEDPDVTTLVSSSDPRYLHENHALDDDQGMFQIRNRTATAKETTATICVSCRLPGGLVLSVKIYPGRRVRHLKTALLRQQTRFQNEDQFDLYSVTGKALASDATLELCGVHDRTLVQVVPRQQRGTRMVTSELLSPR